jgi:hypothetical protein
MAVDPVTCEACYEISLSNSPDVVSASARFVDLVESSGPFYLGYRQFWSDPSTQRWILDRFESAYRECFYALCCIAKEVRAIIRSVCAETDSTGKAGTSPPKAHEESILEQFKAGYEEGRPILRFLYIDPNWRSTRARVKRQDTSKHLDPIFVMRHLLCTHISSLFSSFDLAKECCYLPACTSLGGTNELLLDRQGNGLICMDFDLRGQYLRERIHVLMTLWDLSTFTRARDFGRLLTDTLKDTQTDSRETT